MPKDMSRAHEARRERVEARQDGVAAQVQEILASERVNEELRRKLCYAQERARGDSFMSKVRDELLREAMKGRA